jgi:hypothetical protein
MEHEGYRNTSDIAYPADETRIGEDYVWATNEEARQRALSLYLIRSIVERHGGTIDIDLATETVNINVPENEQMACAQKIEEEVGSMCH